MNTVCHDLMMQTLIHSWWPQSNKDQALSKHPCCSILCNCISWFLMQLIQSRDVACFIRLLSKYLCCSKYSLCHQRQKKVQEGTEWKDRSTSFFLCLLVQTRGKKKKKKEFSYRPLDLNEEMGGLVHTEKWICAKAACELGVLLLVTNSLEDSNQTFQCTDAQVTLTAGSSGLVMFLAARFMPLTSFF